MGDRLLALKPPGWETVGSTARQLPDYLQEHVCLVLVQVMV